MGHYGHLKIADLGFSFDSSWRDEKTLLIRNGRFVNNSRSRSAKTFVGTCAYICRLAINQSINPRTSNLIDWIF